MTNTAHLVSFRGRRKLIGICGNFATVSRGICGKLAHGMEFGRICRGKLWSLVIVVVIVEAVV